MLSRVIRISEKVWRVLNDLGKTSDTFDSVLRRLIEKAGYGSMIKKQSISERDLVTKGGRIPHNTKLRAHYKGEEYRAEVTDGYIILNGKRYGSPSMAAVAITGSNINGWLFWKYYNQESDEWRSIEELRRVKTT